MRQKNKTVISGPQKLPKMVKLCPIWLYCLELDIQMNKLANSKVLPNATFNILFDHLFFFCISISLWWWPPVAAYHVCKLRFASSIARYTCCRLTALQVALIWPQSINSRVSELSKDTSHLFKVVSNLINIRMASCLTFLEIYSKYIWKHVFCFHLIIELFLI